MFYPELLRISKNGHNVLANDLIDKIDTWLGLLPEDISDKITISRFSANIGISYQISRVILERLCELNVLERLYAILCPECNHVLKVTDERNLVENSMEISFCYSCNEEIMIDQKNIEVRYKLIRKPQDPEKMKTLCQDILGDNSFNEEDSIENLFKKSEYNSNKLFYNPTEEQYKTLEDLFRGVNKKYNTTTEKGTSLEDLALALLNTVKVLSATNVKTSTNQIDCFVVNKLPFPNTVLEKIGDVFYCECKNEKAKPDNNYFHKLNSIIVLSRSNPKKSRLGIVFSRFSPTNVCDFIAQKTYCKENIFLVNFELNELQEIIFERKNFLDYLKMKIDIIENDLVLNDSLKKAYLD